MGSISWQHSCCNPGRKHDQRQSGSKVKAAPASRQEEIDSYDLVELFLQKKRERIEAREKNKEQNKK